MLKNLLLKLDHHNNSNYCKIINLFKNFSSKADSQMLVHEILFATKNLPNCDTCLLHYNVRVGGVFDSNTCALNRQYMCVCSIRTRI